MSSKQNQRSDALALLPNLLSSIGITDKSKDPNSVLKETNYFICEQFEKQVGVIEVVLCNEKYAEKTMRRLADWGITESSIIQFRRNNIQSKLKLTVREILETKELFVEESSSSIVAKSKEQLFIEELLTGKNLAPTIKKIHEDGYFEIVFPLISDYQRAENILGEKKIDCVIVDKTLLVLIALPDTLLAEKRTENPQERVERNVAEYATRLKFFLSKVLIFSVHTAIGCKHKGANCVSISGSNGSRRLDFHSPTQRELAEMKLIEAGFFCEKPSNGEKSVLIIDLKRSTQKELLQNIENNSEVTSNINPVMLKELPTTREILNVLETKGIKKTSGFTSGNRFYFYFKDEITAKEAFDIVGSHFLIPGLKTNKKGVSFPSNSVNSTPKNRGSVKTNPPEIKKVDLVTKETTTTPETIDTLFEKMKSMMLESVAQLEKRNSELETELNKLNEDYILLKKGVDLEFSVQELGAGISTKDGKIVVSHNLLLKNINVL